MAKRAPEAKSEAVFERGEVTFDVWFSLEKAAGRFPEWQRSQLRAFMRGLKLGDVAEKEEYDRALKKF